MHAFLLISLLLGADGSQPIGNARSLVDKDWTYGVRYADDVVVANVISLREGDQFHTGTVWLVQEISVDDRSEEWRAWKGVYNIFSGSEPGTVLIKLGLLRKYTGLEEERLQWKMDRVFEPQGAELEITLDENNSIPENEIQLLITRGFFVDGAGDETVKYYPPSGFLQKLSGQGTVRRLHELDFDEIGESYIAEPLTDFQLGRDGPPGFHDRKQ